jgi:hypothetical protein
MTGELTETAIPLTRGSTDGLTGEITNERHRREEHALRYAMTRRTTLGTQREFDLGVSIFRAAPHKLPVVQALEQVFGAGK